MIRQIIIYIVISIAISLGIGYCSGHYIASSKAEKDIATIRAILEAKEAEEVAAQENLKRIIEKERELLRRRR